MTSHFIVEGCTWAGKPIKSVSCGHKHKSASGAQACVSKMRKAGKAETYRVVEIKTAPFLTTGMHTVIVKQIES
jgi:hypothetical protein